MGSKNYPYWWFYLNGRNWQWERHEASGEKAISPPFPTLNECRAHAMEQGYQKKGPGGRIHQPRGARTTLAQPGLPASRKTRPPLIANVDDRPDALYTKSRMLRVAGYQVIEAATGETALELVAAAKPELVVLDVMLPDVTGWDVCRRLKSNPATAHILVVHVSATCLDREHEETSLSAGADAYLRTPMEAPSLVTTVRTLLARKSGEAVEPQSKRDIPR